MQRTLLLMSSLTLTGLLVTLASSGPTAAARPVQATPLIDLNRPIDLAPVRFPQALDVRWYDYNNDGYDDALFWGIGVVDACSGSDLGADMWVYRNVPNATTGRGFEFRHHYDPFRPIRALNPGLLIGYYDMVLVDVDGDGDQDLVAAGNGYRDRVFILDSTGPESEYTAVFDIVANQDSEYWRCWTSEGSCHFPACMDVWGPNQAYNKCNVRDCDVVKVGPGANGCVHDCESSGPNGSSQCDGCGRRWSQAVQAGDIDGDGDQDLIFGYRGSRPTVFLNEIPQNAPLDALWSTPVAGGPGPATLFVESTRLPAPLDEPQVCQESSSSPNPLHPFPGACTRDVQLSDLDRDGDLDVVVMRRSHNGTCDVVKGTSACLISAYVTPIVYFNRGNSPSGDPDLTYGYKLLGDSGDPCVPNQGQSITVADLNADGWPDILAPVDKVGPNESRKVRIYLNDGQGVCGDQVTFSKLMCNDYSGTPQLYTTPSFLFGLHDNVQFAFAGVFDFNNDKRPDIALGAHNIHGYAGLDEIWIAKKQVPIGPFTYQRVATIPHACDPSVTTPQPPCLTCAGSAGDDTRYIRPNDIDLDGDLDYIGPNFKGDLQTMYLNTRFP